MELRKTTNPDLITDLKYAHTVLVRHPQNVESRWVYQGTAAELKRRGCRVEVEGKEVRVKVDVEVELALLAGRFGGDLLRDVPVGVALDALTPAAWDAFIQRALEAEEERG